MWLKNFPQLCIFREEQKTYWIHVLLNWYIMLCFILTWFMQVNYGAVVLILCLNQL